MYLDQSILVKAANEVPPLPQTITKLMQVYSDPDYSLEQVVRIVELDSSLTGLLLRLANSAVYGSPVAPSARTAINRIGSGMVQALAFASGAQPQADVDLSMFDLTIESYWTHTIYVTAFAEELARQRVATFGDDFMMAAVIHDFGKLVMASTMTAEHQDAMTSFDQALPEFQKEYMVLGVNHAEVTAVVCQFWGLSDSLVRTVQFHHDPDQVSTPDAHGLNLANQFAWRHAGDPRRNYVLETESRHSSLNYFSMSDDDATDLFNCGAQRCQDLLELFSA